MASDKKTLDEKPIIEERPVPTDLSTFSNMLPRYDGSRRTLPFYITCVENALALVTNRDDPCIACLIRNKLTGKAIDALSDNPEALTWEDIKSTLKQKFGEFRTEIQLVRELMTIKRENSSIDAFGDKIKHMMSTLISVNPEKREFYKQMALETFLDKLNPITAMEIKINFVKNLDQAIIIAKQEEFKLRARRNEQGKPSTYKQDKQNKSVPFQKKPQNKTPNNVEQSKKLHFQNETDDDEEDDATPEEETEDASEVEEDENFLLDVTKKMKI